MYVIIETTQSDVELYEVCNAMDLCQSDAWTESDVQVGDGYARKTLGGKLYKYHRF